MNKLTIIEINNKLIGNICAWGETNEDERVIKRLDDVDWLVLRYIEDLVDNAKRIDDYRGSIKDVAIKSKVILDQIRLMIGEVDNDLR